MERKLAAIFSTDVKGYSRLMGDDEEATIRTLKTYREIITSLIEHHHGRVVDSPGDNMLAEFASAVDAVQSAVAIQDELKRRNAELDDHRKMEFRIGLNVGDVIADEGRLYGDGVNIAARLEGLADPGGICLSESVHTQVCNKLTLQYAYLGEQAVKNIATPVPVYKVQLGPDETASPMVSPAQPRVRPGTEPRVSRRWLTAFFGVAIALVAVAIGVVRYGVFLFPSTQPRVPSTKPLPLPDKPSIAVLPFTNMSGDPEQEYFSDGLTDTLITDLSRVSGLFVIARNSVFFYKEKVLKLEDVARELGVRYVLESSVQKAGDRVRINTQLVDASTGGHVWAARYDRELQDLFVLQDEIAQKIVFALEVSLSPEEQGKFRRFPTESLEAYDLVLRGRESFWRFTAAANAQARQLFAQAIALDPDYAAAYALLGGTHLIDFYWQWRPDPAHSLERAFALAQQAVSLDDSLAVPHSTLGVMYVARRQYEEAVAEGEKAIVLDPNNADAYVTHADTMQFVGNGEKALKLVQKAMRLNPRYPTRYLHTLATAYWSLGQYEEVIKVMKRSLARTPDQLFAYTYLAGSYSMLGREEEARAAAAEAMRLNPQFSLEEARRDWPYKDPADLERRITALRKAGLK